MHALGGLLLQIPIVNEAEWPVIALVVGVVGAVVAAGWRAYIAISDRIEKSREKELAIDRERREWTSSESEKNRQFFQGITQDFKEALWQMETRRDQNAEDQGAVLNKMADTLAQVAKNMEAHDKTVNDKVVGVLSRIDEQTRPRTTVNKGSSRGAG